MNLSQITHLFRSLSGRHDIADADAGQMVTFLINEGSRFLDRLNETQKSWASCFRWVDEGYFSAQIPYCRAIKEVWAHNSEERWQLEKKSLQDLISGYMTDLPSDRDSGTTLYYSPMITRYIPEDATLDDFEAFAGFVDVLAGDAYEYNGILIAPPPDERIGLDIRGLYYSARLEDEIDENYWSAAHPLLLTMATMHQLEVVNLNSAKVTSLEKSIKEQMITLGMDLVEELIAEADQMEG